MLKVNFTKKDGAIITVEAPEGLSILEIAHRSGLEEELEGACGGALACSTCHVIVAENDFAKLGEATEDEEDMLDLAFGLTKTSRLGCQIIMSKDLDGATFKFPSSSRNMLIE